MSNKPVYNILLAFFVSAFFLSGGCLDDPVGRDYYDNLDLIKGRNMPPAPCLRINTDPDPGDDPDRPYTGDMTVVFEVGCVKELNADHIPTGPDDEECVYPDDDPDTPAVCEVDTDGDSLRYFLYVSSSNPVDDTDFNYYHSRYRWVELLLGNPFNPNNSVGSESEATFYFWATSWDGGRESMRSNIEPFTFVNPPE